MADSLLLPITIDRLTDSNGDILGSGKVYVYDAGTTDEKNVYTDSALTAAAANPIIADSGGWLDARYVGTGSYKLVIKDSDDAAVKTIDNLAGALDTSGFTPTFAKPDTPVINKAADYAVASGDLGKVINVDPTGGTVVITMLSAVTAGDGARVTVRHVGSANAVTLAGVSGQTVDGATSRNLTGQYESYCMVSDGANWHVDGYAPPVIRGPMPYFAIADRLTAPPTSPNPGARYILNGTGTGLWSGYSEHDVLESNGQGGWVQLAPADGWLGYLEDENILVQYRDTAWVDLDNVTSPSSSYYPHAVFQHVEAQNTHAGATVSGAWTVIPYNTEVVDTIGITLDSNTFTGLAAGTYRVRASHNYYLSLFGIMRLYNVTAAAVVATGQQLISNDVNVESRLEIDAVFTVTDSSDVYRFEYFSSGAEDVDGLGTRRNASGQSEYYGTVYFQSLAAIQGPAGAQGAQGEVGYAGQKFTFSTTTSMADPGAGLVRLNNATLSSVTAIAIDDTSAESGNPDVSGLITSWDDGSSATKGRIRVSKIGAVENFAVYDITGLTDNSGWSELAVSYVDHAGSFSNTDAVAVEFVATGDKGDTGATGPTGSTSFDFDTTTADADPGSGALRINNAAAASATEAYIDNNNRGGSDISAWLDALDDNGDSGLRGYLHLWESATKFHIYAVSGSVTDGTGYRKVTIASVAGSGEFTNGNEVVVSFFPRGPAGAVGGTTGGSDGLVLRSDGSGGTTLQASGVVIDDSDNVTGMATNTLPNTGLHLLDTDASHDLIVAPGSNLTADRTLTITTGDADRTLTLSGNATLTGSPVEQGKHTIWIPAAAMVPATTSGAASATLETTTNKQVYKVLDFDASADEYAHFQIAMPNSWNEGTVTFQAMWSSIATDTDGVAWALEGVAISDNEAIDASWGTAVVVTDDAQSAAGEVYVTSESAAVTIAGTPAANDLCFFRVSRDVSDANDDMTEDARLIGIKLFITLDAATDA